MKQFRKNKEDIFICEECDFTTKSKPHLCIHINKFHNSKEYHNKWIKEKGEGKCKICKSSTKFISVGQGYKNCCSKQCGYDWNHIQIDKSILEKYGVKNISQLPEIKKKKNETCIKNHRVENVLQLPKIKKLAEKKIIEKYGVKNPSQNPNIFLKQQKSRLEIKKYKHTNLWYQGSYELDFLEKFFSKNFNIERGPTIYYQYKGKTKTYYSDFYIPSLNLVVEIKSSYLFERDIDKIKAKEKATISNGFNYVIIIDKDYTEFITTVPCGVSSHLSI